MFAEAFDDQTSTMSYATHCAPLYLSSRFWLFRFRCSPSSSTCASGHICAHIPLTLSHIHFRNQLLLLLPLKVVKSASRALSFVILKPISPCLYKYHHILALPKSLYQIISTIPFSIFFNSINFSNLGCFFLTCHSDMKFL